MAQTTTVYFYSIWCNLAIQFALECMYSPAQSFLKVCHGNFWQSLWTSRRLLVFLLLLWCCLLNSNQKSKSAPATNVKSANNWQSLGINVALSLQNCSGVVELVGGGGWKIVGLRVENLGGGWLWWWLTRMLCVRANFKICWPQMAKVWQVNGIRIEYLCTPNTHVCMREI